MSTFHLEPSGFYCYLNEFPIFATNGGEEVVITTERHGKIRINVKSFMDDHSNGRAEFTIENFNVNNWTCDYARISWNWNNCGGFIMIDHEMHPVAIPIHVRFGIAQGGLEALCEDMAQRLMTEALQAMKNHNSAEDYLREMYAN